MLPIPLNLTRPGSLIASAVLTLAPPVFYALGTNQSQRSAQLVFEALFFLSLAIIFFTANLGARHVALLAGVRWLCESWATFGRAYRTRFWGALCLLAFFATIFELSTGQRVTDYLTEQLSVRHPTVGFQSARSAS